MNRTANLVPVKSENPSGWPKSDVGNFLSFSLKAYSYYPANHNYNKIVTSDWLSTALTSALIGQFNRTVRVIPK